MLLSLRFSFGAKYNLVTLEYPPYEYTEDGEMRGVAVRIVRELFRRLGHEADITFYPWARAMRMMKEGRADGIFTIFRTPEREAFLEYSSRPLFFQDICLFVRRDSALTWENVSGRLHELNFGVVRNVSYGPKFDALVAQKNITRVHVAADGEEAVCRFLEGRFDILVSHRLGAMHLGRKLGRKEDLKMVSAPLDRVPCYIAFSRKRNLAELRARVDEELGRMMAEGVIDAMKREAFDE